MSKPAPLRLSAAKAMLLMALVFVSMQSIPTLAPVNTQLNAESEYVLSYLPLKELEATSLFQMNFSSSQIGVPEGNITATAVINGTMTVDQSKVSAHCTNKVCTIKAGAIARFSNLKITFGQLTNPKYTANQTVSTLVYFAANINSTTAVIVSSTNYQPMAITVNSLTQSDEGVGTNNVTYVFNVSFSFVPANPEISIEIPEEIGYNNGVQTEIGFFGGVQNIVPTFTANFIVFQLISEEITAPDGFMLLTMRGFRNPRFLGLSSSFNVTMSQRETESTSNCITCRVAILYADAPTLLQVSSSIPGDVATTVLSSSNTEVGSQNTITVGVNIVAPIPVGGKFRIMLPPSMQPSTPVACRNIHGFQVSSSSHCVYDSGSHAIETVEFYFPHLEQAADLYMDFGVLNPEDNRQTEFTFESYDDQGRIIGQSREAYPFSATPLELACTLSKTNSEIESEYSLSASLTLSKTIHPNSDFIIVTLPPSDFYDLSEIACISASQSLSCNASIDELTGSLMVRAAPPCSDCSAGSTMSLSIHKLINPSFISEAMQSVTVQTSTASGIMESFTDSLQLEQKELLYSKYLWVGGQTVGQEYQIETQFDLPQFVVTNGGYVEFYFTPNATYTTPQPNTQTTQTFDFTLPDTLTVATEDGSPLVNFVEYFEDVTPKSVKYVRVEVCTASSPCPSSLKIERLLKPFYRPDAIEQTLQTTTLNGDAISMIKIDCSQFRPQLYSSDLGLQVSQSVVNVETNYVLSFQVPKLPFDRTQTIQLTSQHRLGQNGRCFVEVLPLNSLSYGFDCEVTGNAELSISFDGESTQMQLQDLEYSVSLIGVVNPHSVKEMSYEVELRFAGMSSASFLKAYALQDPFPLTVESFSASNSTIFQNNTLTIGLRDDYYPFDQMKVLVPKSHFSRFMAAEGHSSVDMSETSTVFTLSEIYQIGNHSLTLSMVNEERTSADPSFISVQMFVQGFLSSEGSVQLDALEPVFLQCSAASSSRVVGQNTTLTVSVQRVNALASEKFVRIEFDQNLIVRDESLMAEGFEQETAPSTRYSFTQEIEAWTAKNLSFTELSNVRFIPSESSRLGIGELTVLTLDASFNAVSKGTVSIDSLLPNQAAESLGSSCARDVLESNVQTNLTLSVAARYPELASKIKVTLPAGENEFVGTSNCYIDQTQCTIYERSSDSITIEFVENSTVTLTDVVNLYPSAAKLKAELMTSDSELIETSQVAILPAIELDSVEVALQANTSEVAATAKLDFTLRNLESDVEVGSQIRFDLPDRFYTKVMSLNSEDCLYAIGSTEFTGCQYVDHPTEGWLDSVVLSDLGPEKVAVGSIIRVTLFLTNPWAAYSFDQQAIKVSLLNSDSQPTSSGLVLLSSVYPSQTSFEPMTVQNTQLHESNLHCGQNTIIELEFSLPVPIFDGSVVKLKLPNSIYQRTGATSGVLGEDSHWIHIQKQFNCSSAFASNAICLTAGALISYEVQVQNLQFAETLEKSLEFWVQKDGVPVSTTLSQSLSSRIPLTLNVSAVELNRSSTELNAESTVVLALEIDLASMNNSDFKLSLTPSSAQNPLLQSVSSAQYVPQSGQTYQAAVNTVSAQRNEFSIVLQLENTPYDNLAISMEGTNPKLALLAETSETYTLSVFAGDSLSAPSTVLYYQTQSVPISNRLVPLSTGLQLHSSNPVVGEESQYSVVGDLPWDFGDFRVFLNESLAEVNVDTTEQIQGVFGTFANPESSNWKVQHQISVRNDSHMLYLSQEVETFEALQSLTLPDTAVESIIYDEHMEVSSQQTVTVEFVSPVSVDSIILKTPNFYESVVSCAFRRSSGDQIETLSSPSACVHEQNLSSENDSNIDHHLTMSFSELTNVQSVVFTFRTPQYQKVYPQESRKLVVETELPTRSYSEWFRASVYGSDGFDASLQYHSQTVNTENNFTLELKPISREGALRVYYPEFLSSEMAQELSQSTGRLAIMADSVSDNTNVQLDSASQLYYSQFESTITEIMVTLSSFMNPHTNQPFQFTIEQSQSPFDRSRIYGRKSLPVLMTQLQLITVHSAQRNSSKIGESIEVSMEIEFAAPTVQGLNLELENCVISLPLSQVEKDSTGSCSVQIVQGVVPKDLPCALHPTLENSVVTHCTPGRHSYVISGFKNVMYSLVPEENEKPSAFIGQPYRMAESTALSTPFLLPMVTAGNLTLHAIESSSSVRLEETQLSLSLTLENVEEVDCLRIAFEASNYLISDEDLRCRIQSRSTECWASESSVMVNSSLISEQSLEVAVEGLINYVTQANFTIETLKFLGSQSSDSNAQPVASPTKAVRAVSAEPAFVQAAPYSQFAVIDVFYSTINDVPSVFTSNSGHNIRVINAENFVSPDQKQILVIFDDVARLPRALPKSNLRFNISSNLGGCSLSQAPFETTLAMECRFDSEMTLEVSVEMYLSTFAAVALTDVQRSSYIYPALTPTCSNQHCDMCSSSSNTGFEHCFACRQNMYSHEGSCTQNCPSGYAEYSVSGSCEQCSSACASCFDIFTDSCLTCSNGSHLNYNGQCLHEDEGCPAGYAENGYCVGDDKCFDDGCAVCSATGFCYDCLPDYEGEPVCQWVPLLPALFMTYWALPFLVFAAVSIGVVGFRQGRFSAIHQSLFSLSLLEFMAWVLVLPAFHNKEETFLMVALIVLRILIGIVAYETHYKKQIASGVESTAEEEKMLKNEDKQKSESKQEILSADKKESDRQEHEASFEVQSPRVYKFVLFLVHVLGPDAVSQIRVFCPQKRIVDKNAYLWFGMADRALVFALMGYVLSMRKPGDLTILPIIAVVSGLAISLTRLFRSEFMSKCWGKVTN